MAHVSIPLSWTSAPESLLAGIAPVREIRERDNNQKLQVLRSSKVTEEDEWETTVACK